MNRFALWASLLLWGWHTGRLWLALPMLAIVELCGLQKRRWHLGDGDWQRVLLVSAVLLVGVVVYAANVADLPAALFVGISWLPPALFPLIVMQRLSADPGVPLSVFLAAPAPGKYMDFALPFAATTLLAAASANTRSEAFFPALVAALALGLWPLRRPGVNPLWWMGIVGAVAALGFVTADGLARAQTSLEEAVVEWLSSDTLEADSDRSVTRIGSLGRVKLSGKVVLRVQQDRHPSASIHLIEATYDELRGATWTTPEPAPLALISDNEGWKLTSSPPPVIPAEAGIRIEAKLTDHKGVLPLPLGAARISGITADHAERNRLGSVRIEGSPTIIDYRVVSGAELPPPGANDLVVPTPLTTALRKVENEIHLAALPPEKRIDVLTQFFADKYTYTLDLGRNGGRNLAQFLTTDRRGHCEYFASATALLLRQSGVPTRYAIGFFAHDYSPMEHALLVRARDAHAWVLAWIDGRWQVADTTPGNWTDLEDADAPFWDPVGLLISRGYFALRAWWQEDADAPLKAGGAGLVVGLIVLVWLWRKQRSEASGSVGSRAGVSGDPFAGTAFFEIAKRLRSVSSTAGPHETVRQWTERAALHARVQAAGSLESILALHYRDRYDPARGGDAELRARVVEWTEKFDRAH